MEVVRRFCERDDQTSLDSLMASLHPDIEWIPIESDPEYSVHRGHDDVRAWLTSWQSRSGPALGTRSHPRCGERSRGRVRRSGGPR
jgi:hypothetical protein